MDEHSRIWTQLFWLLSRSYRFVLGDLYGRAEFPTGRADRWAIHWKADLGMVTGTMEWIMTFHILGISWIIVV